MARVFLSVKDVSKVPHVGEERIEALHHVSPTSPRASSSA
jgi:hypothetical protein